MGWKHDVAANIQSAAENYAAGSDSMLKLAVIDAYSSIETAVQQHLKENHTRFKRNSPLYQLLQDHLIVEVEICRYVRAFGSVRNDAAHRSVIPSRELVRRFIGIALRCLAGMGIRVTEAAEMLEKHKEDLEAVEFIHAMAERMAVAEVVTVVKQRGGTELPYVELVDAFQGAKRRIVRQLIEQRVQAFDKLLRSSAESQEEFVQKLNSAFLDEAVMSAEYRYLKSLVKQRPDLANELRKLLAGARAELKLHE